MMQKVVIFERRYWVGVPRIKLQTMWTDCQLCQNLEIIISCAFLLAELKEVQVENFKFQIIFPARLTTINQPTMVLSSTIQRKC